MRGNPERVAWLVLLAAFATFCLVVVAVPLVVRWYILNAEAEREASVESLHGTIVVEPPTGRGPVPLGNGESMTIPEGTVIRADDTSEAFVTFFDHTMRLFSETTVRLDRLQSRRFDASPLPDTVYLSLLGGQIHIGTALYLDAPLDFRVMTLQSESRLDADGSYALEANNDRSEITVRRGRAWVSACEKEVELGVRQFTRVELNQPPQPVTGAARELIVNGDFRQPLSEGWRVFNDQGTDGGDLDGRVEVVVTGGRWAANLTRTGGHGNHCETVLEQTIDRTLPDPITSLVVRATVKVRYQSLSGGGYLSSEYPLMIRVTYRDVYDSETEWVQGFYYQNVEGNPTTFGLQIPRDQWYPFESENLLESLFVRPFKIMSVRVYASGWDYDSLIQDIHLIVE